MGIFVVIFTNFHSFAQNMPLPTNGKERLSGNQFLSPELIKLSQDLSSNPISLWLDQGEQIWQKECQSCHQSLEKITQAVVDFPKWKNNRLMNFEDQMIQCFSKVNSNSLGLESQEVLAISSYISLKAKGLSISSSQPIKDSDKEKWQRELSHGANIYTQRQGRVNLSCTQCHDQNIGKNLRSDVISPAYLTGFPIYRQSWQAMGGIDRRLRACYSGVQAKVPGSGDRDLRALELYLKQRSVGLIWEGPSIRR